MIRWGALGLLLLAASAPAAEPPPAGQGKDGDWANFARYRAENQTAHPRVVFMGDSITEAWAREPVFKQDEARAGRGISGQTSLQMLVRFQSDVVTLKPEAVHIMAGTNDVAGNTGPETDGEIEGAIMSMAALAKAAGIHVVLASIPPAAGFPWRKEVGDPTTRIKGLNAWIKDYAAREHLVYVDYWPALATPAGAMKPEFSKDGVHPNPAGYAAMEPLAAAAVQRALR